MGIDKIRVICKKAKKKKTDSAIASNIDDIRSFLIKDMPNIIEAGELMEKALIRYSAMGGIGEDARKTLGEVSCLLKR
jgi:hypothetical protein